MNQINRKTITWTSILVALLFFIACDSSKSKSNSELDDIKEWIYEVMDQVYFWNYSITNKSDHSAYTDPKDYFNSLIHVDDKWSWITDDYAALEAEFDGNPTSMGYAPMFVRLSGTDNVIIIVRYVYDNSPADNAGLERGDIILTINNQNLTIDNYYDSYIQKSYSVQTAQPIGGNLVPTGESFSLMAAEITNDPVQYYDIISSGSHKIGYLVYTDFIIGADNVFQNKLLDIFSEFKSEAITDLIVDLRDNRGGEIDAAGFLASSIVPFSSLQNHDAFIYFDYNDLYDNYFRETEGVNSTNLVYRFPYVSRNLNLNRVFFLIASNTASASELVIVGLEPYMDVITIGENTAGKYTGAWVIPDQHTPPQHNWAVIPIVTKYSNANGYTDFNDGLTPDYFNEENIIHLLPYGDNNDDFLNQAISIITGEGMHIEPKAANEFQYELLPTPEIPQSQSVILTRN